MTCLVAIAPWAPPWQFVAAAAVVECVVVVVVVAAAAAAAVVAAAAAADVGEDRLSACWVMTWHGSPQLDFPDSHRYLALSVLDMHNASVAAHTLGLGTIWTVATARTDEVEVGLTWLATST